jgi:hypothetical protein
MESRKRGIYASQRMLVPNLKAPAVALGPSEGVLPAANQKRSTAIERHASERVPVLQLAWRWNTFGCLWLVLKAGLKTGQEAPFRGRI